jgi:hypothetical protein
MLKESSIRNTPLLNTVFQAERHRSALRHLPETGLFNLSLQRHLVHNPTDGYQYRIGHSRGCRRPRGLFDD